MTAWTMSALETRGDAGIGGGAWRPAGVSTGVSVRKRTALACVRPFARVPCWQACADYRNTCSDARQQLQYTVNATQPNLTRCWQVTSLGDAVLNRYLVRSALCCHTV